MLQRYSHYKNIYQIMGQTSHFMFQRELQTQR